MTGTIAPGDATKLLGIIVSPPAPGLFYRNLVLNSPGGDAVEALRLSHIVKEALLTTSNTEFPLGPQAYTCSSACVVVLLAGASRLATTISGGRIGLHRPYFPADTYRKADPSAIAQHQAEIMERLRRFFINEGMPNDLIEKMMNRSSKEIYWVPFTEWIRVQGRASWYEEMLIARCNYDPQQLQDLRKKALDGEKLAVDAAVNQDLRVGVCETRLTYEAQQQMRKASEAQRQHPRTAK